MQTPPVAIGGIGGSGTRVIAGILQDLGYYLGDDLNDSLDNLWFTLLFKRRSLWPPAHHQDEIDHLASLFLNLMTARQTIGEAEIRLLEICIAEITEEHPLPWRQQRYERILRAMQETAHQEVARWGWKEPNTHILLPGLKNSISDLKYVHVMRHGVDMALSANQNQLKLWGEAVLGRQILVGPGDSLRYWCETHKTLQIIEKEMDANLLLLNFDKFCEDPGNGLQALASFLEIKLEVTIKDQLCSKIQPPESLGRYQQADKALFEEEDLEFVREMGFVV